MVVCVSSPGQQRSIEPYHKMGKQRGKKQRGKQLHAMDAEEEGGGGGDCGGGWLTGPAAAAGAGDFIGMDTGDAGIAAAGPRQPGEKVERKRGKSSSKQKQRKRKSLEKALAVASRTETKVAKVAGRKDSKKALKKLWQNEPKDE